MSHASISRLGNPPPAAMGPPSRQPTGNNAAIAAAIAASRAGTKHPPAVPLPSPEAVGCVKRQPSAPGANPQQLAAARALAMQRGNTVSKGLSPNASGPSGPGPVDMAKIRALTTQKNLGAGAVGGGGGGGAGGWGGGSGPRVALNQTAPQSSGSPAVPKLALGGRSLGGAQGNHSGPSCTHHSGPSCTHHSGPNCTHHTGPSCTQHEPPPSRGHTDGHRLPSVPPGGDAPHAPRGAPTSRTAAGHPIHGAGVVAQDGVSKGPRANWQTVGRKMRGASAVTHRLNKNWSFPPPPSLSPI